jgi:hypothetical protein
MIWAEIFFYFFALKKRIRFNRIYFVSEDFPIFYLFRFSFVVISLVVLLRNFQAQRARDLLRAIFYNNSSTISADYLYWTVTGSSLCAYHPLLLLLYKNNSPWIISPDTPGEIQNCRAQYNNNNNNVCAAAAAAAAYIA